MKEFRFLTKNKISHLPKSSGVYAFKKDKEILYIGKATNIRERIKNHFSQPSYRDGLFLDKVSKIGYVQTNSEIEALILEANLIKKYQPKYNVVWRDDKNYFFVVKTEEDFPRIFWTHQTKIKNIFIGPFVEGNALKQTLKVLRKIFPYRSCKILPDKPCLWYHLERCLAPCQINLKSQISNLKSFKLKIKRISQRNARNLMKILKEGKNPVLKDLKKEMKLAAGNQDFEEAAKIRDQIESLEKVIEHAKVFEPQIEKINWSEIENKLKDILKIKKGISRIEAYDVSNIVGQQATGSMVTFRLGRWGGWSPDKNFYRKFKIKFVGKQNDVAMLKEILTRRLKHPEWPYPDLILIDGGIAQLSAALQVKNIKVIALAKKENKLFIESQKKPILLKNLPREISDLILQLRDEAHRFARKYHLKLREFALFPKP